jgi:transcriptional regulator with PAS, ATPase and Fis domain
MPAELDQGFQVDPADLPSEAVIFGSTAAMLEVRDKIECAHEGDFPVLLQGERGTCKELVARFLHVRSKRREGPFVKLSCAAIRPSLLEGELFGYDEGSCPGSADRKRGLVEIADEGTLFLDEIGEIDWTFQRKLLHLLQNGRYFRVGGREECQASVRIVCATNVNLALAIKRGTFRRDLFEQLDVMCLHLSALRDRMEDIPQLWGFFAEKLAKKFRKKAPQLTPEVLEVLTQWSWPGNLYELENCIARIVILGDEEAIEEELRRQAALTNALEGQFERNWGGAGISRYAGAESVVLRNLETNRRNQRKSAEELKRTYRSLLYRLRGAVRGQRPRNRKGFPRFD